MARARAAPVAVSVVAHAAVFGVLVWGLSRTPEAEPERVMQVELGPAFPRRPAEALKRPTTRAAARSRIVTHEVVEDADAPAPVVIPQRPVEDDVRQALRWRLGCERTALIELTAAERERCRERLVAGIETAPKLALRRAAELEAAARGNPEPYLNRRPKNGCKPRAAGDASPMGREGAAAGVDCAWSF